MGHDSEKLPFDPMQIVMFMKDAGWTVRQNLIWAKTILLCRSSPITGSIKFVKNFLICICLLSLFFFTVERSAFSDKRLIKAVRECNIKKVEEILSYHPDKKINRYDQTGTTAFIEACQLGHIPIIRLLLKTPQLDVNKPRIDGTTALIAAARAGQTKTVRLLLRVSEIDQDQQDKFGNTALIAAEGHPEIVALLRSPEQPPVDFKVPQLSPVAPRAGKELEKVVTPVLPDLHSKLGTIYCPCGCGKTDAGVGARAYRPAQRDSRSLRPSQPPSNMLIWSRFDTLVTDTIHCSPIKVTYREAVKLCDERLGRLPTESEWLEFKMGEEFRKEVDLSKPLTPFWSSSVYSLNPHFISIFINDPNANTPHYLHQNRLAGVRCVFDRE